MKSTGGLMFCRSGARKDIARHLRMARVEGTRLTASNRREPIRILQQRTPAAVIDHLKLPLPLSLLCLSFLADTQRLVFYPENQVLWCKLSPRAIYKNSWVCAPVCISHSKEETRMGLFVILEVLFSPGAQIFQSRPPQRKKSKALSFFKHLSIPLISESVFLPVDNKSITQHMWTFLHILTTPSLSFFSHREPL